MKSIQNSQDLTSAVDTVVAILMADAAGLSNPGDIDTAEQLVSIIDEYTNGNGWNMVYDKMEEIAPKTGDLLDLDIDDDFVVTQDDDDTDYIITDDEYDIDDLDDGSDLDDEPYYSDEYADLEW